MEIKYLVDDDKKPNEQSVNRLRPIAYVLPFYKNYNIQGIYFPNPFLKKLIAEHDESKKLATWENWLKYDPFSTRANASWISVIERQYEFSTNFEWQEYWFKYRQLFLDWLRQASRVLEVAMTDRKRYDKEAQSWIILTNRVVVV